MGRCTQREAIFQVPKNGGGRRLLMDSLLHRIPVLRRGRPYWSLDAITMPHYRTRQPFVQISQANSGLIRRDLLDQEMAKAILGSFTCKELFAVCARAAGLFAESLLPLGD